MITYTLTAIAPVPWTVAPLDGKYYGTRIVDYMGRLVCEIWDHERPNVTGRRVSRREEQQLRVDMLTEEEWNEFIDDYLCDNHFETEEDYLLACQIVEAANNAHLVDSE